MEIDALTIYLFYLHFVEIHVDFFCLAWSIGVGSIVEFIGNKPCLGLVWELGIFIFPKKNNFLWENKNHLENRVFKQALISWKNHFGCYVLVKSALGRILFGCPYGKDSGPHGTLSLLTDNQTCTWCVQKAWLGARTMSYHILYISLLHNLLFFFSSTTSSISHLSMLNTYIRILVFCSDFCVSMEKRKPLYIKELY